VLDVASDDNVRECVLHFAESGLGDFLREPESVFEYRYPEVKVSGLAKLSALFVIQISAVPLCCRAEKAAVEIPREIVPMARAG
jgi:hypothetical protein